MRRPLAGLRVIDLGSRVSAPFCAAILGEQGAEVIKIEEPVRGDRLRELGPYAQDDAGQPYSLYGSVEGRGRKSVTLDLRRPEGQELIDVYMYGSILRIMEWTIAAHDRLGMVRNRSGDSLDIAAPVGNYPSRDGRYVYLVGGSQTFFERLCQAMDRPELATDERFADAAARAHNRVEINAMVAEWVSGLDADEAEARLVACDVPAGKIYDVADLAADEHVQDRGDLCTVQDPVIGPVRQQAPFPRMLGETPAAPSGAPRLGEHTEEVLSGVLGLSGTDLAALRADNVI